MTDIKEDAPANAAGSGAVAGLGVGPQGEPPGPQSILTRMLKRKKLEQEEIIVTGKQIGRAHV